MLTQLTQLIEAASEAASETSFIQPECPCAEVFEQLCMSCIVTLLTCSSLHLSSWDTICMGMCQAVAVRSLACELWSAALGRPHPDLC